MTDLEYFIDEDLGKPCPFCGRPECDGGWHGDGTCNPPQPTDPMMGWTLIVEPPYPKSPSTPPPAPTLPTDTPQ